MAYYSKRKGAINEEEYDMSVSIFQAEGLDNPNTYPAVTLRYYRVVFWVHPYRQYRTDLVEGLPDPNWREKFLVELGRLSDTRFLHVEVLRLGSTADPGTSAGSVLVGRTQIPLPKLSKNGKRAGRFGLVRLDGAGYKAEGHISLSMELVVKKKRRVQMPYRRFVSQY